MESIKTDASIAKCLEYSEDKEALSSLLTGLGALEVKIEYAGLKESELVKGKYSQHLRVELLRPLHIQEGREIKAQLVEFDFGMSIHETEILHAPFSVIHYYNDKREYKTPQAFMAAKSKVKNGILYSILACCRSDYYCPEAFDEFCDEFGYDTDSRKAVALYERCIEQKRKLQKIFIESEIECLPS